MWPCLLIFQAKTLQVQANLFCPALLHCCTQWALWSADAGQDMNGAATQGRLQVDLESLAFSEEGHFMSNRKVNLPPGSQRNSFKVLSPAHEMPILQLASALHVPSIMDPDACGESATDQGRQQASQFVWR